MLVKNREKAPYAKALGMARCSECFEGLEWELRADPGGAFYFTECCGNYYTMRPVQVVFQVEKANKLFKPEQ